MASYSIFICSSISMKMHFSEARRYFPISNYFNFEKVNCCVELPMYIKPKGWQPWKRILQKKNPQDLTKPIDNRLLQQISASIIICSKSKGTSNEISNSDHIHCYLFQYSVCWDVCFSCLVNGCYSCQIQLLQSSFLV